MSQSFKATAPASIGNLGVGYDIMGLAFDALTDSVIAEPRALAGIVLGEVTGCVSELPAHISQNAALRAADAVWQAAGGLRGMVLHIEKGIPLRSGLGGSGASAVAGAAAANAMLGSPFTLDELLPFALEGEAVSADPPAWDNVIAALHGGLVMAARLDPPVVRSMPIPEGLSLIMCLPDIEIETGQARDLLKPDVALTTAVEHARRISAFTLGMAQHDHELIKAGLEDILIEPQRLSLLPSLSEVKAAALSMGALGCSFSGSGPAVFALSEDTKGEAVREAMTKAFELADLSVRHWNHSIRSDGVRIEALP